ncbi:MAG TPA: endopeptidase La [Ktedonobacterales bacterium]|jgi:ATP-dependent Lon protease
MAEQEQLPQPEAAEEPRKPEPAEEPRNSRSYPLVPLKNTVVFPRTRVTLTIGREKSIRAVEEALANDRQFIAATQTKAELDDPQPDDIYSSATLVDIISFQRQAQENTIQLVVEGARRVKIVQYGETDPFLKAEVHKPVEPAPTGAQAEALVRHAISLFEKYAQLNRRFSNEDITSVISLKSPARLADVLSAHVVSEHTTQLDLLETLDPLDRLEKICVVLGNEIEVLELEAKIRQRVRQQVDKNQKEYYLKEQLRAIQEELGHDTASEVQELRDRMAQKGLPPEAETKVRKEIDRLERMPQHSAELVVLRNYIDWVLALPWNERTEDRLDIAYAQVVLDEDHYGLDKVKERIIEFLAVRQLRMMREKRENGSAAKANGHKGPILCLIGPPGVGKTSLGHSIARALGRKFARISLGGVHDEAEIRGHRRTYVGALPGRIIQAMKTVGVRNPVFLLDEIDKMAADYRGDPAAALLEVLDPEQNNSFTDHYLELAYDLSEVFFICTGNLRYQIPRPLADRMDIVEIPGYTEEEKASIGRTFLLPKVLREHGLAEDQVQISPKVMRYILSRYTREAGVRSLERQLATISRKAARRILLKPESHLRLTTQNIEQYLGIPRYTPDHAVDRGQVGVATGLAWTEHGGTLLPVEVVTMPGKGALQVTGQLGEVMQESARAALSYIRSRAEELSLPYDFAEQMDLHIHLPEGAIPKDGPSAGITIATAIISALTRRPVRNDVAMTGEITLRGRVLPIGGLKEKVLAAHRVGIHDILVPEENRKDVPEIPAKIRNDLRFTFVKSMDEVVREALLPQAETPEGGAPKDTEKPPVPAAHAPTDRALQPPQPEAPRGPDLTEIEREEENLPLPNEVNILPEESAVKFQGQEPPDPYSSLQG